MKPKVIAIAITVLLSVGNLSVANAGDQPIIEKFTVSQTEVDLKNPDLKINFEAVFTHPDGLVTTSTILTLTNGGTNTLSVPLIRTDIPVNFSKTSVTYRGSITFPRNLSTGVYTYTLDGVTSNLSSGLKISSGMILGPNLRSTKGAESGLLVRDNGFLDLDYSTINGPTYENQSGKSYINVSKYLSASEPIWKIGEDINPNDYFESTILGNDLQVATTTPNICSTDGKVLKLISIGDCSFTVYTPRTREYLQKTIYQSKAISASRKPQTLTIESVATLSAKNLPITLLLSPVYASGVSAVEYVMPKSVTPEICGVSVYALKIVSGGQCVLTYQSLGNAEFLPTKVYTQLIFIEREIQKMSFSPPETVDVSKKHISLNATVTSGKAVTYSSITPEICSISSEVLNLLKTGNCSITATQIGTTTLAPISTTATILLTATAVAAKKTISCIKGKTTKKVTGTNPKCPTGYKLKK